jgi:hypothetical protein
MSQSVFKVALEHGIISRPSILTEAFRSTVNVAACVLIAISELLFATAMFNSFLNLSLILTYVVFYDARSLRSISSPFAYISLVF